MSGRSARSLAERPADDAPEAIESSSAELGERVAAERVRMIYNQLPVSISGTMIGVVVLVVVLREVVSAPVLMGWFGMMLANQGWRLALYLRFREGGIPHGGHPRWGRLWAIGAAISGVLWGAAGVMFFVPDSPAHQTIVLALIFAITGTGVALLAPHPPSFYVFLFPTMIPVLARNAWEGDGVHLAVAFIVAVMTLSIIGVHRRNSAMIGESLRNRYRNMELVERLQQQNVDLDRARQLAEQANRAKTRFFAAASHDLRQPLHALGLFAGALSERVHDPAVLNLVHSINSSVDALESLFNELLDLSKLDAGVIRPALDDFAVQAVFNRLALDFEPEAAERGLRLIIRPTPQWLYSDPVLLERVLRNLLMNGLRNTRRGGVLLACRRRGLCLRFEVWDSGVGIQAEQRDRIFEEFYQGTRPADGGRKGMGLGLSIVQRLCRLLGSEIHLASRPNRGSVFRFDLPAGRPRTPEAAVRPPAERPRYDFAGAVAVVIDDDETVISGMRVLLEGWGMRVVAGVSELAGVAELVAAGLTPDLLITDLHLGEGVSGFEVTRSLRRRFGATIPAILITGSVGPEHADRARAEDLHFLLKPVNPAKLRTLIHYKLKQESAPAAV
jgi:signal transduction histidine kinase/CheY-like chemotaxis protein